MALRKAEDSLQAALSAFNFGGPVTGVARHGRGHINDTFAVTACQPGVQSRRFILQRINTYVFKNPAALMQNIVGVTGYLQKVITANNGNPARETLTVVSSRQGLPYFTAPDGSAWRVYLFIEDAVCYQVAETPALFEASGQAFGNFTRLLQGYPAETLHETIPHFHNTPRRFENFLKALRADALNRAQSCAAEVEFVLGRRAQYATLTGLLQQGRLPLRVTHNDTKLNNIMMDPAARKGVCIIDLDTVMPGLSLYDYGDSIRYGANTATEDEKDRAIVSFSLPLFESYTRGYLKGAGDILWPLEKQMMPWGAKIITLECGMRFLTDYLEGDLYFKAERPGHNLQRAQTQFALAADMERQWEAMRQTVQKLAF
ncbi:MAG: phosphotransferase enzyme family protein [Oscillospiraceae bacterium]